MMILNLVVTLLCLVLKSNGNDDGKEGNYISGVTILFMYEAMESFAFPVRNEKSVKIDERFLSNVFCYCIAKSC